MHEAPKDQPRPPKSCGMRAGDGRNRALWERCMRAGAGCGLNGMLEVGRKANSLFEEPLMDAEVVKVATSAWQHDAAGLNFFTRPRIMIDHDTFDTLGRTSPDAMLLLLTLERYHGGNDRFALAKPWRKAWAGASHDGRRPAPSWQSLASSSACIPAAAAQGQPGSRHRRLRRQGVFTRPRPDSDIGQPCQRVAGCKFVRYPLTDPRQFDILLCAVPARGGWRRKRRHRTRLVSALRGLPARSILLA
jgi:hypothetical protein